MCDLTSLTTLTALSFGVTVAMSLGVFSLLALRLSHGETRPDLLRDQAITGQAGGGGESEGTRVAPVPPQSAVMSDAELAAREQVWLQQSQGRAGQATLGSDDLDDWSGARGR